MRSPLLAALSAFVLLVTAAAASASPGTGPTGADGTDGTDGPSLASAADGTRVTYTIETLGPVSANFGLFVAKVIGTLNDPRGWRRAGITFRRVNSGADVRIMLATPAEVAAAAPVCSAQYSCRVGNRTLINEDRWRSGAAAWDDDLDTYREYVVNHEMGHWLGLGHASCPAPGTPAPVMVQQSISLEGCVEHGWPHVPEVRSAAAGQGTTATDGERHGVIGRPQWLVRNGLTSGGVDAAAVTGSDGGVPVAGDWNGDGRDTPGMYDRPTWTLYDGVGGSPVAIIDYGHQPGDVPVVGDWNADGVDEIGIFRNGVWHLRAGLAADDGTRWRTRLGRAHDTPVVGDWNGSGADGLGIYRHRTWYLQPDPRPGGVVLAAPTYGLPGDAAVAGDWDGNGHDGIGIYRRGEWWLRNSLSATGPTYARGWFGVSDDLPVVGDWNGDGADGLGLVRGHP